MAASALAATLCRPRQSRAPFGDRPRLTLVADSAGEVSAKRSANLRRAVAASIAPRRLTRSSFSAMRLSSSGRLLTGGRRAAVCVDRAGWLVSRSASPSTLSDEDPARAENLNAPEPSPAGRSSEMTPRDARAIGIDGTASTAELAATSAARTGPATSAVNTARLVVKKTFVINRMDTLLNRSPDGNAQKPPTTPGHETQRGRNRFDRNFHVASPRRDRGEG
jgi:hypothetical protein